MSPWFYVSFTKLDYSICFKSHNMYIVIEHFLLGVNGNGENVE